MKEKDGNPHSRIKNKKVSNNRKPRTLKKENGAGKQKDSGSLKKNETPFIEKEEETINDYRENNFKIHADINVIPSASKNSFFRKIRNFFQLHSLKESREDMDDRVPENSFSMINGSRSKDPLHEEMEEKDRAPFTTRAQVFNLIKGRTITEVMVPRIDVISVPLGKKLPYYVKVAKDTGFSRIPVFGNSIDDIKGVLYVKDLLRFMMKTSKDFNVEGVMRTPYVVPETMELDELLKNFLKNKIHLSVVVDEYGGVSGIVTLEDIIEEIIGEIHDEYDKEQKLFKKLGPNTFQVDAKLSMEDIQKLLGKELPEKEFDTIGGVLYDLFGRVPRPNEEISIGDIHCTILSLEGSRIKKIRIDLLPKSE